MGCAHSLSVELPQEEKEESESDLTSVVDSVREDEISLLLSKISCLDPMPSVRPMPRWADYPSTESATSLARLNKIATKRSFTFDEDELISYTDTIIQGFASPDRSYQQLMVYFLFKMGKKGYTQFMQALVDAGIIKILVPFLSDKNKEFNLCTAFLCEVLYNDSFIAKDQFNENKGLDAIIKQRSFNNLSSEDMSKRLSFFLSFMTDAHNKPIDKYVRIVYSKLSFNTLQISDIKNLRGNGLRNFLLIMKILLEFKNNS